MYQRNAFHLHLAQSANRLIRLSGNVNEYTFGNPPAGRMSGLRVAIAMTPSSIVNLTSFVKRGGVVTDLGEIVAIIKTLAFRTTG
jgi:hypothetical protein